MGVWDRSEAQRGPKGPDLRLFCPIHDFFSIFCLISLKGAPRAPIDEFFWSPKKLGVGKRVNGGRGAGMGCGGGIKVEVGKFGVKEWGEKWGGENGGVEKEVRGLEGPEGPL